MTLQDTMVLLYSEEEMALLSRLISTGDAFLDVLILITTLLSTFLIYGIII